MTLESPYDRKLTPNELVLLLNVLLQHPKLTLEEALKALVDAGL